MSIDSVRTCGALALSLALAACAPDSVKPNSAFDAWTSKVAAACNYQTIGRYQVGALVGMNATDQATIFLDSTSRLYSGEITADQWTLSVTTDLNGQPGDPGVACVLAQLPSR
jgi:hypothetical protein